MSELVATRIRRAIQERGPITFAEFMEDALYGPGGFYEQHAVGTRGHFLTSPHVHPIFAEILLRAIAALGKAMDAKDPLSVVEIGAGDGTLADALLRLAMERSGHRLEYTAVERSSHALAKLRELPIRVVEDVETIGAIDRGVVFANELLDNLPFRRVRGTANGLAEVRVDAAADRFVEVEVPCDPELQASVPNLQAGQEAAMPIGAIEVVDAVATSLRSGYVLLIDYGAEHGLEGDVHGYRDHRPWDDVLREPGSADITIGVDFEEVAGHAESGGLAPLGLVTQREAMLSLGFADWAAAQLGRQAELMTEGSGERALRVFEGRSRASLLVDPARLGSLRWLLLATQGLPRPTWLTTGGTPAADPGTARRSPV